MSLFPKQVELALRGELQDYIRDADEALMRAARLAMQQTVGFEVERLRGVVQTAGLGGRLANAIRGEVYPKSGLSREPAGWIYVQPNAVKIFEAFDKGALIRSGRGVDLAIPIPGSPADRKLFGQARAGETVLETFRARGVQLSLVPARNGKPAMLVAENVRVREVQTKSGPSGRLRVSSAKLTKSGAFAKGAASVPLFWLIPEAKMPKRLDWRREFERATAAFMQKFAAELARAIEWVNENRRAA